jgi:AcrR family transcriptional regulator
MSGEPVKSTGARLTANDWADAALVAMSRRGLAGLAIEPLALELGATKGSFYWHFANRDALIAAALNRWQDRHTEAIIAMVQSQATPRDQLRLLIGTVIESTATVGSLELALLATADHPQVAVALAAVTRRRIDFTASLFVELGFSPDQARQRGLLAFSAYLGHAQLAQACPGVVPATGRGRAQYVDGIVAVLLAP